MPLKINVDLLANPKKMIKELDARLAVMRNNFELCYVPYNGKRYFTNPKKVMIDFLFQSLWKSSSFLKSVKLLIISVGLAIQI